MKLNDEERAEVIEDLIENSCCWDEDDREILENLDEELLIRTAQQLENDRDYEDTVNELTTANQQQAAVINAMPAALAAGLAKKKKPAAAAGDEEEEEEEEAPAPTGNLSEEEWLEGAPQSIRDELSYARNMLADEKTQLIQKLTGNADKKQAAAAAKVYRGMSLNQLKVLAGSPAPATKVATKKHEVAPIFFGQGGGVQPTVDNQFDETEDVLDIPIVNYATAE